MKEPDYLHKSYLQAWMMCPLKYKYMASKHTQVEATFEMDLGTKFHDFARDFFEFLDYETLEAQISQEGVRRLFRYLILDEQPEVLKPLCENFILFESERYWRLKKAVLNPLYYFKPVATELYVKYDEEQLAGTIDRVDRMKDGSLAIVEYKTGNPYIPSVKLELAFYKLLLEKAKIYKEAIDWMVIYNPDNNKFFMQQPSYQLMGSIKRRITQFKKAHEMNIFPKREGLYCAWCTFKSMCLETNGGGE